MYTRTDVNGEVHKAERPVLGRTTAITETLTIADMGTVIKIATDAKVLTLPTIGSSPDEAMEGSRITFRNTGADGNNTVTISPVAANRIYGTVANGAADSVASGALDKDIVNTKATANKGDYITLESDGGTGWYIVGGVGIWASEA